MQVCIFNHYTGKEVPVTGTESQVFQRLEQMFPWFAGEYDTLGELLDAVDSMQGFGVDVVTEGDAALHKAEEARGNLGGGKLQSDSKIVYDMLGFDHHAVRTFEAARFLSARPELPWEQLRGALWSEDGEVEPAALRAHGLEVTPQNLAALRAVRDMGGPNSAPPEDDGTNSPQISEEHQVEAGAPEAEEAAEAVRRAFADQFVLPVQLGGKHSEGSYLARDSSGGRVYLLKPGSGGQSPAAGAQDDAAGQSAREAAFWQCAELVGLGAYYPRADLLSVDGRPYAALEMLPWSYQTLERVRKESPGLPQQVMQRYLGEGLLHRWAALDYVLGNPDRHANNVMVSQDRDVALIDHGSAFAGRHFDPARDQNSFVPYYLRAWAKGNFHQMNAKEKLRLLPRLSEGAAEDMRDWVLGIRPEHLAAVMQRYGINPDPTVARLEQLQVMAQQEPPDLVVDRLWAGR